MVSILCILVSVTVLFLQFKNAADIEKIAPKRTMVKKVAALTHRRINAVSIFIICWAQKFYDVKVSNVIHIGFKGNDWPYNQRDKEEPIIIIPRDVIRE